MEDTETVKISMTITVKTREWIKSTYPEAQSIQEGLRMAVSDARQHHIGIDNLRTDMDGNAVFQEHPDSE